MAAHKDCQEKDYNKLIDEAFDLIASQGMPVHKALKQVRVSFSKFYDMLEDDANRAERYARACEIRAEILESEMLDIADDTSRDKKLIDKGDIEVEVTDQEAIQRSRLRVETRKWLMGKLKPKKYGEKITNEMTGVGGKDLIPVLKVVIDSKAKQTFATDERDIKD